MLICGLFSGGYYYYVVIYRTSTEPKTKQTKTNTNAVLYDVDEQKDILKNFDEMYASMEGNDATSGIGMLVIPGLDATRTLKSNEKGVIEICTSMTPQGVCVTEEYILVSSYCHTKRHNSVIYVINKDTKSFVKEIVLSDKDHVGGLAYDNEHHFIWVSTERGDLATASAIALHDLKLYDLGEEEMPIAYTYQYDLYMLERDSFMTYAAGSLYIGHFSLKEDSIVQKYEIGPDGGLKTESILSFGIDEEVAVPEEIMQIPKQIQGMAVYGDHIILSQSYGWKSSRLIVQKYSDLEFEPEEKYVIRKIYMPQKMQQIYIDGNILYVLFESAAYAYRAQPLPKVDRICILELDDIVKRK